METYSSILAWRIPQTEEPGRLHSTGSQKVGYDWAAKHTAHSLLCGPVLVFTCDLQWQGATYWQTLQCGWTSGKLHRWEKANPKCSHAVCFHLTAFLHWHKNGEQISGCLGLRMEQRWERRSGWKKWCERAIRGILVMELFSTLTVSRSESWLWHYTTGL